MGYGLFRALPGVRDVLSHRHRRDATDGAYKTKCERLAASNNPNLLLMNYDLKSLSVVNLNHRTEALLCSRYH